MSREELECRYTYQKQKEKRYYEDTNTASIQQKTCEFEGRIADLELEREDFEDQVTILSQKLHRHLEIIDQLMEDKAYFEHLLVESKRALTDVERELEKLSEQLASTQIEARDAKQQLGFATSHNNQLHDKNRALSEEVKSLRDQNARLQENAGHLHAEATRLIDGREEAEEDRANQRLQIRELEEDIADYQDENAQLKAELALLKSGTARRDSVVDDGSPGEGPRSTSA